MATRKKSSGRKYGSSVGKNVETEMREMKRGKLKRGPGGKGGKVTGRKQAIAIGLSEARKAGKKVPAKKSSSKKSSAKKSSAKKSTAKKSSSRKSAKKSSSKKSSR